MDKHELLILNFRVLKLLMKLVLREKKISIFSVRIQCSVSGEHSVSILYPLATLIFSN